MTRINCIPVRELTDKHLLAEYRELPRVFGLARRWYLRTIVIDFDSLPQEYTLGEGHVKFFYTRLWWCYLRQDQLFMECKRRGFKVRFKARLSAIRWAPERMMKSWRPTPEAKALNRARIKERLK